MATATKEAPKKEVAKTNGQETTNVVAFNGNQISREEAVKALQSMEEGEKDSGYLELEPGEERKVVFLGWAGIQAIGKPKGETVPAVKFLTDSGKEQINADAVIVSYFQRQPEGCARKILCKGKKTSEKGEYKTFEFFELNLKK